MNHTSNLHLLFSRAGWCLCRPLWRHYARRFQLWGLPARVHTIALRRAAGCVGAVTVRPAARLGAVDVWRAGGARTVAVWGAACLSAFILRRAGCVHAIAVWRAVSAVTVRRLERAGVWGDRGFWRVWLRRRQRAHGRFAAKPVWRARAAANADGARHVCVGCACPVISVLCKALKASFDLGSEFLPACTLAKCAKCVKT